MGEHEGVKSIFIGGIPLFGQTYYNQNLEERYSKLVEALRTYMLK